MSNNTSTPLVLQTPSLGSWLMGALAAQLEELTRSQLMARQLAAVIFFILFFSILY